MNVDLTKFVNARLASEEAVARDQFDWYEDAEDALDVAAGDWSRANFIATWSPARVLAQAEAMRRIVALHARHETEVLTADDEENVTLCRECANDWPCATIRHLAQPYADRPGFDPEWRMP